VHVLGLALELGQFRAEVRACLPHGLLHALQVAGVEHLVPVLGDEDQSGVQHEDTVPARADVPVSGHEFEYAFSMQLRYS
jgi:hypothetical protein